MNDKFYLGIPSKSWDLFATQAEDILYEERIGQHLVGIYPAGPRIYGNTHDIPSLLCIYIDEPMVLLNPTRSSVIPIIEEITRDGCKIQYIELYSWVKKVTSISQESFGEFVKTYTHIIPAMAEAHYVSEEMACIASLTSNYLRKSGWDIPHNNYKYPELYNLILEAAYLRTRVLLQRKDIFAPCLNKNWDQVEPLGPAPEYIAAIDTKLIDYFSSNTNLPTTADLTEYCDWGYNNPWTQISTWYKKEIEQLGNTVSKFFCSLL